MNLIEIEALDAIAQELADAVTVITESSKLDAAPLILRRTINRMALAAIGNARFDLLKLAHQARKDQAEDDAEFDRQEAAIDALIQAQQAPHEPR